MSQIVTPRQPTQKQSITGSLTPEELKKINAYWRVAKKTDCRMKSWTHTSSASMLGLPR
jgi:hypothetical protein